MQLTKPRVVIIGGGFGGLTAAKSLKNAQVDVVLIEKTNHHLFQPLLYQVATAALSPGDIALPLRAILSKYSNIQVIMEEAISIDKSKRIVEFRNDSISFDYLIVAPGNRHSYFGKPEWEQYAPGLKNLQDALYIRERILKSFEKAVRVYNSADAAKYLTFVIIGGGPTGVELAGSIAEVGMKTMLPDFPILKYGDIKVVLIEAGERILPGFEPVLSAYAHSALNGLGVEVLTNTKVLKLNEEGVETNSGLIHTANALWAAGNSASGLLISLDTELDKSGRAIVEKDLSIPNYSNIFVIGDSAKVIDKNGNLVPGVAPAAMQEAKYVAENIKNRIHPEKRTAFDYIDKGNLATIGMAKAIAQFGKLKFSGFFAWILWTTLHIFFLINFRNKLRVFIEWCWYYLTHQPGARLIVYDKEKK